MIAQAPEERPVLEAEKLSKTYRSGSIRVSGVRSRRQEQSRRALVEASLKIARGAVLGVVGESGSGKSTLARCLSLLEKSDSGRVILDGTDLTSLPARDLRHHRRRIQVVFQDPYASLNPRLTVGAALGEVLRVHRLAPRADVSNGVRTLLGMVGLSASAAERYPADFSGGQRQRICIARALAAKPDVLIADEPLSSLDVSIQAQILNLLLDLRDQLGLAMIFVSHDLHIVRRIAPTIAVMFGGRIVEVIPPEVPLAEARHPYTRALLAALPSLSADLPSPGEVALSGQIPTDGCSFRERCPLAFDPCARLDPALLPVAAQHFVACHHVAGHETSADDDQAIVEAR